MLNRRIEAQIRADLEDQAAVALLGPRQVGKTTLALAIAEAGPSVYLDLEDPADRDKLADPALYLSAHEDKLVIIDARRVASCCLDQRRSSFYGNPRRASPVASLIANCIRWTSSRSGRTNWTPCGCAAGSRRASSHAVTREASIGGGISCGPI
jgi:energy-coupling factor transporter ATP-binding protein EcfA2